MIVLFACVGLGTFAVAEVAFFAARPKSPQELQVEIEKQVAEVKATLPQKEGDLVTWLDIEARWQTIVYKYKIHAPRDLVVAKKKDIESQTKGSLMLGAAKMMMPKGVHLEAELYDDYGSYIYTLDLD
ncbi:MAG TPA: hypothetical protein VMS17_28180 [Gemmataceae bacterium]|nr:hypothetical protein [Gemmataceae bacterium]